jgi:predicted nicotinamide N-methyase
MLKVLELGSGTGLVGLAAAAIWQCMACLTDLPDIVENLDYNIDCNCITISEHGGAATAKILDWSNPPVVRPGGIYPVRNEHLPSSSIAEIDF